MSLTPHILVLAAGQGKRMVSKLPKVLHPVLFKPMLHHVLDRARELPHASISVVVGHGHQAVREACAGYPELTYFHQTEQLGTAHAVSTARAVLEPQAGHVLILSGDVILLQRSSLEDLLRIHESSGAAGTLLSAELDNPKGYGRIVRNAADEVTSIREEVDCDESQRALREVNAGIYCFRTQALFAALTEVKSANRQKEFYLTDVVEGLVKKGQRIAAVRLQDPIEMTGINDRLALAQVERVLQTRTNRNWMLQGVSLQAPETGIIDPQSVFGSDVRIETGCQVVRSRVGSGTVIEAGVRLFDTVVGENCVVKQGTCIENSELGKGIQIGPYAHLRPGSRLEDQVKIGNFVEVKKSHFGAGSKASHLSYVGDAEIGKNVNLGCGFVTCNYDGGPVKHKTVIEDNVFVGSDSQTVAPVRVGQGSYVASGTTVTEDVPPDSLALSRGKQITKVGYAAKYREKLK